MNISGDKIIKHRKDSICVHLVKMNACTVSTQRTRTQSEIRWKTIDTNISKDFQHAFPLISYERNYLDFTIVMYLLLIIATQEISSVMMY